MRVGIDIGGTFTDFVLLDEISSAIRTYEISSTPQNPAEAVLEGLDFLEPGSKPYIIHGSIECLRLRDACVKNFWTPSKYEGC